MKFSLLTDNMVFYRTLYHYWNRRGRDRMLFGYTATCAISAYHH